MQFAAVVLLGSSLGQPPAAVPNVQFSQTRRFADTVVLEWTTNRVIDEKQTRVDFRAANRPDSPWRQVLLPAGSTSGVMFSAGTLDPLAVRVSVTDYAGRTGVAIVDFQAGSPDDNRPAILPVFGAADPSPPSVSACTTSVPQVSLIVTADGGSPARLQAGPPKTRWEQMMNRTLGAHLSIPHVPLPVAQVSHIGPHLAAAAGTVVVKGGALALNVAIHLATHISKK